MKITTAHSMIKSILKDTYFVFIMEPELITIMNMIPFTIVLFYDFVGVC